MSGSRDGAGSPHGPRPADDAASSAAERVVVEFLGTPVQLFLDLQEALDGYQREIQLGAISGEGLGGPAGPHLVELREAMIDVRTELHDQTRAARAAGREVADLIGHYPPDARSALVAVMEAAHAADDAAEAGTFLGMPLSGPVRQVQQWMFEEVLAQLEGRRPRPFVPPA